MAKLESDSSSNSNQRELKTLWNASHLLTLGLVNRFSRNYNRYREQSWNFADKNQLISLCYELEHKIYTYENLQFTQETSGSDTGSQISSLILRQQIFEYFEQLHHQLLYREPDTIDQIIPLIDHQLRLWETEGTAPPLNNRQLLDSIQKLSHIEMLIHDQLSQVK